MAASLLFAVNAVLNLAFILLLARVLPPAAYGALSVWLAAALFVATSAFDFVRLSAMRFYTPKVRVDDVGVRASLDAAFAIAAIPALAGIGAALAWHALPGLTPLTAAALAALAIGNAASEYLSALARCRFDARTYGRLVALRHVLTIGAVVPIALFTGSAELTLVGLACAVWPSVVYGAVSLRDAAARPRLARAAEFAHYARYGLPLIAAEALFQAVTLVNRTWLAAKVDLVAAGAYALTFDLAFRVMAVMASVCEASLFPRLVVRHEAQGDSADALTQNTSLMLLILVPSAVGYLIFAEPFAALVIAPEFRGAFVSASAAALAGATLYILQIYVLRPAFQIELATVPLLRAAVLAFVVNGVVLALHPVHGLSSVVHAHLAGLFAGCAALAGQAFFQRRLRWPVADSFKIALAGAAMLAVGLQAPFAGAGAVLAVLTSGALMSATYALTILVLDAAGMRRLLSERMRPSAPLAARAGPRQ